jgi:hypothetical protein
MAGESTGLDFEIVVNAAQGVREMADVEKGIDKITGAIERLAKVKVKLFDDQEMKRQMSQFMVNIGRIQREVQKLNRDLGDAAKKVRELGTPAGRPPGAAPPPTAAPPTPPPPPPEPRRCPTCSDFGRPGGCPTCRKHPTYDQPGGGRPRPGGAPGGGSPAPGGGSPPGGGGRPEAHPGFWRGLWDRGFPGAAHDVAGDARHGWRYFAGSRIGAVGRWGMNTASAAAGVFGGLSVIDMLRESLGVYESSVRGGAQAGLMAGSRNPDAYGRMVREAAGLPMDEAFGMSQAFSAGSGRGASAGMLRFLGRIVRGTGVDSGVLASTFGELQRMTGGSDRDMVKLSRYIAIEVGKAGIGKLPDILNATQAVTEAMQSTSIRGIGQASAENVTAFMAMLSKYKGLQGGGGASLIAQLNAGWRSNPTMAMQAIQLLREQAGLGGYTQDRFLRQAADQDILKAGFPGIDPKQQGAWSKVPIGMAAILNLIRIQAAVGGGKLDENIASRHLENWLGIRAEYANELLQNPKLRAFLGRDNMKREDLTPELFLDLTGHVKAAQDRRQQSLDQAGKKSQEQARLDQVKIIQEGMKKALGSHFHGFYEKYQTEIAAAMLAAVKGGFRPQAILDALGKMSETTKAITALGMSGGDPAKFAAILGGLEVDKMLKHPFMKDVLKRVTEMAADPAGTFKFAVPASIRAVFGRFQNANWMQEELNAAVAKAKEDKRPMVNYTPDQWQKLWSEKFPQFFEQRMKVDPERYYRENFFNDPEGTTMMHRALLRIFLQQQLFGPKPPEKGASALPPIQINVNGVANAHDATLIGQTLGAKVKEALGSLYAQQQAAYGYIA